MTATPTAAAVSRLAVNSSVSSSPALAGDDGATVVASAHHLPPPMAGYTFQHHLRSTLSHDTFVAQRHRPDADAGTAATDLVIIRVYALDYLKWHDQRRNMVEREVLVVRAAAHPNVAQALPAFASKADLYTVEQYYSGGELFESVESYYRSVAAVATAPGNGGKTGYSGMPLSIVGRIFRELMLAIQYLHEEMGVAHRNIKLENVLLDEANHVRLSGLGMCAALAPPTGKKDGDDGGLLKLCCGSKHYVAPELLDGRAYDGTAVDVWAAGVVLFALVCGCFPFDSVDGGGASDEAIFDKIRDGEAVLEAHAAFHGLPDPHLQDLLRGTFKVNPKVRLSVAEILEHPFL